MQLFQSALHGEIHHIVALKDHTNITLDDKAATLVQRESGTKTVKVVTAVEEDDDLDQEDEKEVAAFQKRRNQKGTKTRNNYSSGSSQTRN
jgi:hypothetical protein